MGCGHVLASACLGKRRVTMPHARRRVKKYHNLAAYSCEVCGCWHTGRALVGDAPRAARDGRASVVAALRRNGHAFWLSMLADQFAEADRVAWKAGIRRHTSGGW